VSHFLPLKVNATQMFEGSPISALGVNIQHIVLLPTDKVGKFRSFEFGLMPIFILCNQGTPYISIDPGYSSQTPLPADELQPFC
jgi:hypothetical protein